MIMLFPMSSYVTALKTLLNSEQIIVRARNFHKVFGFFEKYNLFVSTMKIEAKHLREFHCPNNYKLYFS